MEFKIDLRMGLFLSSGCQQVAKNSPVTVTSVVEQDVIRETLGSPR